MIAEESDRAEGAEDTIGSILYLKFYGFEYF